MKSKADFLKLDAVCHTTWIWAKSGIQNEGSIFDMKNTLCEMSKRSRLLLSKDAAIGLRYKERIESHSKGFKLHVLIKELW